MMTTTERGRDAASDRGRVLVVDDQSQLRDLLREFVELLGYEASTAASGEQAIAALATVQPHVVFLDLLMPGISGLEVLAHVREHHRTAPVIVITGNIHQKIAGQARAGGAFAVVGKPIDLNALKGLVAQAMKEAASREERPPTMVPERTLHAC